MKLAVFAPNVLPVPALNGGAVEELTTYFIEENEKKHIYDIDLYTVDNYNRLSNFQYKYTNILQIKYKPNLMKQRIINILNRFLMRMPNGRVISDFSECLTCDFKENYYDMVIVEDNREVFNSITRKINQEKLIFHVHDDIYVKGGIKLSLFGGLKMYDLGGLRIDRCQAIRLSLDLNHV